MPNGIKYTLMAMFFVIITKVLQVTTFDSKHYEKLQRESSSYGYLSKTGDKSTTQKPNSSEQKSMKVLEKDSKILSENSESKENSEKRAKELDDSIENRARVTLSGLKNNYLAPLLATIPEGQLRVDIVIRYYRHKKDLGKIDKLKELSYYIHEKEATETAGMGSNTLYYGDDVPLEDIQIIALTLLEVGVPLKSIKHTKFEWKAKAIEIGTDTALVDDRNMSIQEIQDFHKQYLIGNE